MQLNDIREAKYIALETFKKNGQGVKTPVWQAAEGNNLYVWTEKSSWKVKRARNNDRVRLCASDGQGNPKSEWVEGHARILESAEVKQQQQKRMATKYGPAYWLFYWLGKIRRSEHVVIEISAL